MKKIIFIDCGDTLVDESTQVFDENEVVMDVEFCKDAKEVLELLYEKGYKIVLVADGKEQSFKNIFNKIDFLDKFTGFVVSEKVGSLKPDKAMFQAAYECIPKEMRDKRNIIMVGNNLRRDIKGANNFGITSVWMNWSSRYFHRFEEEDWKPDYEIHSAAELVKLLEDINNEIYPAFRIF